MARAYRGSAIRELRFDRQLSDTRTLVWKKVLRHAPSNDGAGSMGARVRSLRRARGLTLKALGARAGLSHPFLSQLERGLARPSVASIERIAGALGVPVGELWMESPPPAPPRLVRRAETRELPHEAAGAPGGLREISPAGEILAVHEWQGGSRQWAGGPVAVAGQALVYVIRGGVEVEVDEALYALETGDALLFDGRLPHRMRRTGGTATRALVVLSA
jgi:transcriptional regulator with XRE-family HTH domain